MEEAFKCDLCSEELDSVDKLNSHIQRQHKRVRNSKKKSFNCNVCGYKFSKNGNLVYHMRTHTGERPFKCTVDDCGMTFKQESTLKIHIKFKHSDEHPLKYDFPGCLHQAKTTWDLMNHKKVHSDERPHPCPHSKCKYRAKRKGDLSKHTANVHSDSKKISCSKCNYTTNNASHLASHMIVHEGTDKKHPCFIDGCEYKGKNNRAVKMHMRRHKTSSPCPVSGCGRYLATKEALKNHVKLHNPSGRAFQCPLCFKHFATLVQLQTHCAVHTNEKPFQCGHCKYDAGRRRHVQAHISSVHPAIEFPLIVHLPDDRECLGCKVTLTSAEFVVHCKVHVKPVLIS